MSGNGVASYEGDPVAGNTGRLEPKVQQWTPLVGLARQFNTMPPKFFDGIRERSRQLYYGQVDGAEIAGRLRGFLRRPLLGGVCIWSFVYVN